MKTFNRYQWLRAAVFGTVLMLAILALVPESFWIGRPVFGHRCQILMVSVAGLLDLVAIIFFFRHPQYLPSTDDLGGGKGGDNSVRNTAPGTAPS